MDLGPTRYARRGDTHLAYRKSRSDADGLDVLVMMPGFMPMSATGDAFARRFSVRLAGLGRVVMTERQGVGESDPIDPAHPPTIDDVVDDLLAVMDASGLDAPAVFGFHNAGTASVRLASRCPDRVAKLALVHSFVSWEPRADLEGVEARWRERFAHEVEHGPSGELDMLSIVAPSKTSDDAFRSWWDDVGRRGASPRSALAMSQADSAWDVRGDLVAVTAPAIVVHRVGNRFVPVSHARYLAQRLADATLVELPGDDHLGNVGDVDAMFDPVEEFFTGRAARRERSLAAVLFTDLVDSTGHAVRAGDRGWSRLLAEHDQVTREIVTTNGGEIIKSTGDGILAVFVSPAAAIRAARSIQVQLASRDLRMRAGIHAGEVERLAGDITGIAVTIAARVMGHAGADEVLVSGAIPPLVAGSELEFDDRGEVELKGVPGSWTLFAPR
jgi:class 3 adenylate cyclase